MSDGSAAEQIRTASTRGSRLGRAAPLLFMIPLWYVAAFYFRGDLGKWADDWGFHGRDPVTGAARWWSIMRPGYYGFWRPLHIRSAAGLQTLLWSHDWAIHLILACIHALNAWLLWRVLRRGGLTRQASLAGAVAMLVWPAGHEAVFWLSTIGTGMGLAALLMCILAAQRLAADEISRRGLLLHVPVLLTIGWWYEQPAVAAPVIGLAYFALAPRAQPLRRRLLVAGGLAAAAGAAVVIYAAIFMSLAGPGQRGGATSMVNAQNAWPHIKLILRQAREHLLLEGFLSAAIEQGWKAIIGMRTQAMIVGVLLVVGGVVMGSWWMRAGGGPGAEGQEPNPTSRGLRRAMLVLIGMGIAAAGLLPAMLVANQWFSSRLSYIPAAGIVIAAAVLLDVVIGTRLGQSRRPAGIGLRAVALAMTIGLGLIGAAALAGVQSAWHARRERDDRLFEQLRRLVPSPPEHAVFVPVDVDERLFDTGSVRFDQFHFGPFEMSWSATVVRHVYRRADVHGVAFNRWAAPARRIHSVRGGTADGLIMDQSAVWGAPFARVSDRYMLAPWDRVVPFRIGPGGGVAIVGQVELEHLEVPSLRTRVTVPMATTAAGGGARLVARMPLVLNESAVIRRPEWRRVSGDAAEVKPRQAMGRSHAAIELHPQAGALKGLEAIEAELSASDTTRTMSWQLAMPDHLWGGAAPLTDGIGVAVTVDGAEVPVFERQVTPEELRTARRWLDMSAVIPPSSGIVRVRLAVNAGAGGGASYDWCVITPPVVVESEPADAAAAPGSRP